jgi:alpha-tubulin suppressor-like RCC1 family protein
MSGPLGNAFSAQLTGAVAIDGESEHACVATPGQSNTIVCVGANDQMQSRQLNLANPIAVSTGYKFSCALLAGGNAKCWGANDVGQAGNGTVASPVDPADVMGLSGATAIDSGQQSTCALAGGAVKCWGANNYGVLGRGNNGGASATTAQAVPGLSGVTALTVGPQHVCVVVGKNAIKCWGNNSSGQLGDGSMMDRYIPVSVTGW